jgi:hypothetical protein
MKPIGLVGLGLASALIIAVGIPFWPKYRYEHLGRTLVRIHRVTGETAILVGGTWKTPETPEQPRKAQSFSWEAQSKVTGNASLSGFGSFSGSLYNGSDWTVTRVLFRVVAKEADGKVRWDRKFAHEMHVKPLSTL